MKKHNKIIIIVLFILIVLIVIVIQSINDILNYSEPRYIQNGFNKRLTSMLSKDFEVKIPASATIDEGYYVKNFQDPMIYLYFKIDEKDFESMLSDKWVEESTYSEYDYGIYDDDWEFESQMSGISTFTALWYSKPKDGKIAVVFRGWRPNMRGIKTKMIKQ